MIDTLNLNAKEFTRRIGISHRSTLLALLRQNGIIGFFKIGKKYMYRTEDVEKVSQMLRDGDISINTADNEYYLTINK